MFIRETNEQNFAKSFPVPSGKHQRVQPARLPYTTKAPRSGSAFLPALRLLPPPLSSLLISSDVKRRTRPALKWLMPWHCSVAFDWRGRSLSEHRQGLRCHPGLSFLCTLFSLDPRSTGRRWQVWGSFPRWSTETGSAPGIVRSCNRSSAWVSWIWSPPLRVTSLGLVVPPDFLLHGRSHAEAGLVISLFDHCPWPPDCFVMGFWGKPVGWEGGESYDNLSLWVFIMQRKPSAVKLCSHEAKGKRREGTSHW